LREGEHLGDTGLGGRLIIKWAFREVGCGGVDWKELAQDRDRWRALGITVNNFRDT